MTDWLYTYLLYRPTMTRNGIPSVEQRLSAESIDMHLKSIRNLQLSQRADPSYATRLENEPLFPRDYPAVQVAIKHVKDRILAMKKISLTTDKLGGIWDCYNWEQHIELCNYGLRLTPNKPSTLKGLRFRLLHTIGHATLGRGDDRRGKNSIHIISV